MFEPVTSLNCDMKAKMAHRTLMLLPAVLALATGCASQRLSGADLDRVGRPAYISRIEDGAGPRALVFREDDSYRSKLKKLEDKEADRRLQVKLQRALTRFEISERLRATTLNKLPRERPWTSVVDPAQVASALESFLVEEVPANAPDYELLKPLGADAVVEFVIEDYGLRSDKGKAGAYIEGYGRLFMLEGGEEWHHAFRLDQVEEGTANLDPFRVAKEPELFRQALTTLIDRVAEMFSKDLNPPDRRGGASVPATRQEDSAPDSTNKTGNPAAAPVPVQDELAPGELPAPDA